MSIYYGGKPITEIYFGDKKVLSTQFIGHEDDGVSGRTPNSGGSGYFLNPMELIDEIHLGDYDLSNITNMEGTFQLFPNARVIDFGRNTFPNLRSMNSCFVNCKNLRRLDLSLINLSGQNVDMTQAFSMCYALETIFVGSNADRLRLTETPDVDLPSGVTVVVV